MAGNVQRLAVAFPRVILLASSLWLSVAGLWKFVQPASFMSALQSHSLLPPPTHGWLARAVPSLEVSLAAFGLLAACLHARLRPALLCHSALFAVFAAYALWAHFRPPPAPAPCGCGFWDAQAADWAFIAARNAIAGAVLATTAAFGLGSQSRAGGGRANPRSA
ncbi:MAG: hypothetical protein DYG92_07175 [Leptolyngbya sp. PLA1]|nr:hypothetical protein [Leptolyngbya sp. PLA1]